MKIDAGSLKKGDFIEQNNELFVVDKTEHNFHGRGTATLRVKLKNVRTGNALETSFRTSNMIEQVEVDVVRVQYLYKDATSLYFMDERTFEQHTVPAAMVGNTANYLKEGDGLFILTHNDVAIAIRPPQSVQLKVTEADDAVKGDTATNAKKIVTLETGVKVGVPLFIKKGDTIVVDPDTGNYVERITK